jgi:hypothetical protein
MNPLTTIKAFIDKHSRTRRDLEVDRAFSQLQFNPVDNAEIEALRREVAFWKEQYQLIADKKIPNNHFLEELTEGRGHMSCQDCGGKLVWNLEGHGITKFDVTAK